MKKNYLRKKFENISSARFLTLIHHSSQMSLLSNMQQNSEKVYIFQITSQISTISIQVWQSATKFQQLWTSNHLKTQVRIKKYNNLELTTGKHTKSSIQKVKTKSLHEFSNEIPNFDPSVNILTFRRWRFSFLFGIFFKRFLQLNPSSLNKLISLT